MSHAVLSINRGPMGQEELLLIPQALPPQPLPSKKATAFAPSTAAPSHLHPPYTHTPAGLCPHLSWVNAAASAKVLQENNSCCCRALLSLAGPQCVLLHEVILRQDLSLQHLSGKCEVFLSHYFVLFATNFPSGNAYFSSSNPLAS